MATGSPGVLLLVVEGKRSGVGCFIRNRLIGGLCPELTPGFQELDHFWVFFVQPQGALRKVDLCFCADYFPGAG